jgi:hypothetical protein
MLVLLMGGFMNYTIEMDSGAMIYLRSFIKTGFAIQKSIRRDTHTDTQTQIAI